MHEVYLNWQMLEVYKHPARHKVIVGGRRIGKTEYLLAEALKGLQLPGSTTWYVAPTYRQAKSIFWSRLKDTVPKRFLARTPNETELKIETNNGAKIELRGSDNPDSLRGVGIHKLLMDELDFWDNPERAWGSVLRPMLVTTKGTMIAVGSPNGYRLLKDFFDRGGRNHEVGWKSWLFKTADFVAPRGHIDPEEFAAAKRDMDARTYEQEWEATFLTASGRVCYGWRDENVHQVDYDPKQDVHISLDFNVAPSAATLAHIEAGQTVQQFGEIFMQDAWTQIVADEIVKRFKEKHQAKILFYGDPSGSKRHTSNHKSDWQIMEDTTRAAFGNRVSFHYDQAPIPEREKINSLNARICNATGQRRYFVDPRCRESIKDFQQVVANPDGSVSKSDLQRTHWFDAAGYLCQKRWPIRAASAVREFNAYR